ncbi:venom metalloproteinase antarease TserMP_A-like [Belonocnema kinseyi]|uniref:venom metalloproteinase antarease TserMP_A-like n=1 Tax=Belonocnema kinseyi TaxID=2817044 RepID=UPI00143CC540|nr:venom metalloproteinase antarease TserMP_A-like [Belonocnema kinseyi]
MDEHEKDDEDKTNGLVEKPLLLDKLPYIDSFFRDQSGGHIALDAGVALHQFGKYFYKEHRFTFKKDYDLALLMTGYDLQGENKTTGVMVPEVAGLANSPGACAQLGQSVLSVGLIEDNCGFGGVLTAAHELAHLLGADHDNEGSLKCDDGFLMSSAHGGNTKNTYLFTNCSQEYMRLFFMTQQASCLFNFPPEDEPVPVIMPGQYTSLDEQCKKRGSIEAIDFGERVCTELCCVIKKTLMSIEYACGTPALDGSACGQDSVRHALNTE